MNPFKAILLFLGILAFFVLAAASSSIIGNNF